MGGKKAGGNSLRGEVWFFQVPFCVLFVGMGNFKEFLLLKEIGQDLKTDG